MMQDVKTNRTRMWIKNPDPGPHPRGPRSQEVSLRVRLVFRLLYRRGIGGLGIRIKLRDHVSFAVHRQGAATRRRVPARLFRHADKGRRPLAAHRNAAAVQILSLSLSRACVRGRCRSYFRRGAAVDDGACHKNCDDESENRSHIVPLLQKSTIELVQSHNSTIARQAHLSPQKKKNPQKGVLFKDGRVRSDHAHLVDEHDLA